MLLYNSTTCCRVAATLAASEGIPLIKADFVLEGGSVHTDGEGYALHFSIE